MEDQAGSCSAPSSPRDRAGIALAPGAVRRSRGRQPDLGQPEGGRLRRSNFRDIWIKARDEPGLPDLHLRDLRHTENTMATATGASLRELMERSCDPRGAMPSPRSAAAARPGLHRHHPLMIPAWGRKRSIDLGRRRDQEAEFPLTQRRAHVHQNVAVHGQRGNGPVRGDR